MPARFKRLLLALPLLVVPPLTVGAGGHAPPSASTEDATPLPAGPDGPRHALDPPAWAYHGPAGPMHWGAIDPHFETCEVGRRQSPIDIRQVAVDPHDLGPLQVEYRTMPVEMVNDGHTLKLRAEPGSRLRVGLTDYHLLQVHFHAPSEHAVRGKAWDMVAHLVHVTDDGRLGVLAVPMRVGAQNPTVGSLFEHAPDVAGESVRPKKAKVALADLLPEDLSYYTYEGSLTTPPCTEGVRWMVLRHPVEVSLHQVRTFVTHFPASTRPVQPLHDRTVYLGASR